MISKITVLTLLCFSVCFVSCKKSNNKPKPDIGKDLVLTPLQAQKATTDNAFSFKLFKAIGAGDNTTGNVFISPLSISFAMAMTSNGANGQTLTAIRNAMDFNGFSQDDLNTYYNNLITNLPQLDPNTTLSIANSIWYRNDYSVLPAFISTNSNYYKAQVQGLDFVSPSSVQTINNWVSTQTHGKIPTIINNIPDNMIMYLINALYFKSTWNNKFDESKTAAQAFYKADGSQVSTKFMSGDISVNSYKDNDVTVIELPYSNQKYSMVIVEPKTTTTLKEVCAGLDSTKWAGWMGNLTQSRLLLTMPKFTFSYGLNLNDALKALGMNIAFADNADFSLIGPGKLKITDVEHKAFVAVDEEGTTAAAATSVGVGTTAVETPPPFTINHPFVFVIREMHSGLILFTGIVNDPTAN